ncbi:MAG: 6-phosphofructokinase [Metamycoplasmataceae bacterium]
MNNKKITKIAVLTSGGDSQGMNNAVRAIVKSAKMFGIETFLINYGYKGLVENNIFNSKDVYIDDYIAKGGTFIYSARYPEFKEEETRKIAKQNLDKLGIEALVVIGGDGSYHGAQLLHKLGVKTIALPGTIDNDISSTDFTIGFNTALENIVDAIDKIRDTATSHKRCFFVEVMGRYAGDLALQSGIACGAELIITSENKKNINEIADIVNTQMYVKNKKSVIIVVSELLYDNLDSMAKEVEKLTKVSTRAVVLSHIQRGGIPTASERVLATEMGYTATKLLLEGMSGLAISINDNKITSSPILEALSKPRPVFKDKIETYNKLNQE